MPIRNALLRPLLPLFLMCVALFAQAQEVRNVGGRKHLVHTVEQGQTLYAISRTYAVPVEDIIAANPGSEAGLSIGQELLIPQDAINKKEARSAPVMAADGELLHTVQRKETLFGIARKYDLDINALLQRNPSLNAGLREGMTVVIPVQKVEGQPENATRPAMPERILEHIVKPGETLYSLSKLYIVTPEAIMAANDGLPEGLKAGASVKIPLRVGVEPPPPTHADTMLLKQRYKVALMLPFSVGRNDSMMTADPNEPRFYELSRIAAQFYGGARIALDSLEKIGLRADVQVLDLGDEARIWSSVIQEPEIKGMDLFIGPFHRTAIEQLARTNPHALIVCPVPQTNKLLLGNPKVSKVTPTRSDLVRHTARYVAQRHSRDNVIMLRPDIQGEKEVQEQMARLLQESLSGQPSRLRDSVLVLSTGRRDVGTLTILLDASRPNVIVVPSEDVEFVTAVVGKLRPLASKYNIQLIGMERWLGFDIIAATDLDLLNFTFAASSFIDRNDPSVARFAAGFEERFKTIPDEYAFLGFDVTFFFLKGLMTRGVDLHRSFPMIQTQPLHMGFRMMQAGPENGYRNEHAIMLRQKDLRLVKAP